MEPPAPNADILGLAGLAVIRRQLVDPAGVDEVVAVYRRLAADLPVSATAHAPIVADAEAGYGVGASNYDAPGNLMVDLEGPIVDGFLAELQPGIALDAACGTGRH